MSVQSTVGLGCACGPLTKSPNLMYAQRRSIQDWGRVLGRQVSVGLAAGKALVRFLRRRRNEARFARKRDAERPPQDERPHDEGDAEGRQAEGQAEEGPLGAERG